MPYLSTISGRKYDVLWWLACIAFLSGVVSLRTESIVAVSGFLLTFFDTFLLRATAFSTSPIAYSFIFAPFTIGFATLPVCLWPRSIKKSILYLIILLVLSIILALLPLITLLAASGAGEGGWGFVGLILYPFIIGKAFLFFGGIGIAAAIVRRYVQPPAAVLLPLLILGIGLYAWGVFQNVTLQSAVPSPHDFSTRYTSASAKSDGTAIAQVSSSTTSSTSISTSTTASSTSISATSSWPSFTNTKYGYTVHYPVRCPPSSNDFAVLDAGKAMNVSFCGLTIEPQDPAMYSTAYPDMTLPLKAFAEKIWSLNAHDSNPNTRGKTVDPLTETIIDGRTAYQFSLNTSYTDYRGGMLLHGKNIVVLFANNGLNFIVVYENSDTNAKGIVDSVSFEQK